MAKSIKDKLIDVYNELQGATANIAESKRKIADALRANNITNVSDNETFARYAELINRLRAINAMILEFSIPDSATTLYKRTIVLPMYFGVDGNNGASLNSIAAEILSSTPAETNGIEEIDSRDTKEIDEPLVRDVLGNLVCNGNYTITMDDVERFLNEEQATEFLSAANRLGIEILASDEEGNFEPSTEAMYSYTVNWGDGSGDFIFDETKTYEENKGAIWHTYSGSGVYDVTINGTYKRITTTGEGNSDWVSGGTYVTDVDGVYITSENNYGMRNYLVAVISWGNTLLTSLQMAFRGCSNLSSIPMYDTTNSFADVTTAYMAFRSCGSLTSLPFNSNTNKGLFSGCDKLTDIGYIFSNCTGLTEAIPERLFDGCNNVTNASYIFEGCTRMEGGLPVGIFSGMTALVDVTRAFQNNYRMNGEITDALFKDCPNIRNMTQIFMNCSGLTGTITRNTFGGLSKLTDARQSFYNCKNITGITSDAFYNLTNDLIDFRGMFERSGISSIPEGLFESLKGKNQWMIRMFADCGNLSSISQNALVNLKVSDARGMFGGCINLTGQSPTLNEDCSTYEGIHRWYGAFSMSNFSDINEMPLEVGGKGPRRFPEGKVGAIVLGGDGISTVDPTGYTYDESHQPIGIIYADMYVDPSKCTPDLGNGEGNVVSSDYPGAVHKIYATVLNERHEPWTNGQINAEDITTMTNNTNYNFGYGRYTWSEDRATATKENMRYNGETFTEAINEWRVGKGMAIYTEESGYTKTDTDVYDAVDFVNEYELKTDTPITVFMPDNSDLWDQYVMRSMIQDTINTIIEKGGGYNVSNAYPIRTGTGYWSSAEYSATLACICYTSDATFGTNVKWGSYYVRPSLAIEG